MSEREERGRRLFGLVFGERSTGYAWSRLDDQAKWIDAAETLAREATAPLEADRAALRAALEKAVEALGDAIEGLTNAFEAFGDGLMDDEEERGFEKNRIEQLERDLATCRAALEGGQQ